jgi:hypothetical protein
MSHQPDDGSPKDGNQTPHEEVEEKLNKVLIQMADLQDRIWDLTDELRSQGKLAMQTEDYSRKVMDDVSYWIDQCTTESQSPPVLLRRMEVHLSRLKSVEELLRRENEKAQGE